MAGEGDRAALFGHTAQPDRRIIANEHGTSLRSALGYSRSFPTRGWSESDRHRVVRYNSSAHRASGSLRPRVEWLDLAGTRSSLHRRLVVCRSAAAFLWPDAAGALRVGLVLTGGLRSRFWWHRTLYGRACSERSWPFVSTSARKSGVARRHRGALWFASPRRGAAQLHVRARARQTQEYRVLTAVAG